MTKVVRATGQLKYSKFGRGSEILLAFHGFGQNKKNFEQWGEVLGDQYMIYAFDLFYHGESERTYGRLTKEEWADYLQDFLVRENIHSFSCLGFSLGGRFAIATSLQVPDQVIELILIAPDGIFLTVWFKLATTPILRNIFKYVMLNPDKLESLIQFHEKTRIGNQYVADFVRKEMGSSENRRRVYLSWNHFKSLGFRRKELIQKFRSSSFKRRIILGSKDHIIKPGGILPIIEKMEGFQVDILERKHHQLMDPEVAKLLQND